MKILKRTKKGFTLVELIVVIAIVAILAAVSVVSYLAFINQANESADIQLVKQLNVALQADQVLNGPRDTMHEMLEAMEENGFVVENLTKTKSGYDIVWDQEHNRFGLLNGEDLVYGESTYNSAKTWNIWKFADTKAEAENESSLENKYYSVYLTEEFAKKGVTTLDIKAGLDVGEYRNLKKVNYIKTTGQPAQDVVIRTNGGSVIIDDTNNASHQIHYGSAANVTVATGTNCYEGHAIVGAMTITQGHAIADSGAYVGVVKASEGVTLSEVNNGVFVIPTNVEASAIPASVATQIGYTNNGTTITANPEKTDKSYYAVTSYNDLINFADKWNSGMFPGAANVKFADNIVIELGENEAWTPIGNWQYPFYGVFDGNGCTISGIKADATHTNYTHNYAVGDSVGYGETYGFFGIVGNGNTTIKNMTVDVSIDIANGKDVGGLIGYVPSSKKFAEDGNKYIQINRNGSDKTGDMSDWWTTDNTAGEYALTLESVVVSGSIKGDSHIAGFVGKYYSIGNIVMNNCINNANVIGANGYIGGFIGIQASDLDSITLTNCVNTGNIEKTGKDGTECCAAGLIARIVGKSSTSVTLTNCRNTGNITSVYNAYAYAHINTAANPSITGCSNTGILNHGEGYHSFE